MNKLKDAFNFASIKHPMTAFFVDLFWNELRMNGHAAMEMNHMAKHNYSEEKAIDRLEKHFASERDANMWWARVAGVVLMLPSTNIVGMAFMLVGASMFVSTFKNIPFTKKENPFAFSGLYPEKDRSRAEMMVSKHYHKRFK